MHVGNNFQFSMLLQYCSTLLNDKKTRRYNTLENIKQKKKKGTQWGGISGRIRTQFENDYW